MGDRGRFVVPAELRDRTGMQAGSVLVLIETERGVLLLSREQAKALVRDDLATLDLVGELLTERRREAAADNADRKRSG